MGIPLNFYATLSVCTKSRADWCYGKHWRIRIEATLHLYAPSAALNQSLLGPFEVVASLWGADSGFNFKDDHLFTWQKKGYLGKNGFNAWNSLSFRLDACYSTIDEDIGGDEVYAMFRVFWPLPFAFFNSTIKTTQFKNGVLYLPPLCRSRW